MILNFSNFRKRFRLFSIVGFEDFWRSGAKGKALLPSDIWLHILVTLFHPTLTGRRNVLPKESPKRNVQKEKIEIKQRRKHFLSFIYWVKGLTNATSQDIAWCPKHQTAKWCCRFNGHCLKEKDNVVSFFKRKKSFFSFYACVISFSVRDL